MPGRRREQSMRQEDDGSAARLRASIAFGTRWLIEPWPISFLYSDQTKNWSEPTNTGLGLIDIRSDGLFRTGFRLSGQLRGLNTYNRAVRFMEVLHRHHRPLAGAGS